MSIVKNVSGPYTINSINRVDPIILDSHRVIINGNLTVIGNTSAISSSDTEIHDNKITLNAGETGAGVGLLTAGIEVDRGSLSNVAVIWNETIDKWQLTNDGSTFANISSYTTGVNMERLSDDLSPALGGNLSTAGFSIVNTAGTIYMDPASSLQLDGNLQLKQYVGTPEVVANYNILHAGNVSSGGSGLYVTASEQNIVGQELITKKRAIVYSIIF